MVSYDKINNFFITDSCVHMYINTHFYSIGNGSLDVHEFKHFLDHKHMFHKPAEVVKMPRSPPSQPQEKCIPPPPVPTPPDPPTPAPVPQEIVKAHKVVSDEELEKIRHKLLGRAFTSHGQ